MAEFEKRRARLGTGYYITQEQIEARPIATTSSLLLGVPGVVLRPTRFGGDMITMHGGALGCIATVYVDGMRVEGNVDDFLVPQWIGAIEVYSRAALAPTEYSKGNCGVVLLWTREPEKGGRWTAPKLLQ